MFEDAFPTWRLVREKLRVEQSVKNDESVFLIAVCFGPLGCGPGEFEETIGGNRGSGTLVRLHRVRLFPIVRGHSVGRRPQQVKFCATSSRIQESLVLGVLVGGGKTGQRPGLTASPARVVPPALVGGLPEEFACLEVKKTLVRGAAVASDQETP